MKSGREWRALRVGPNPWLTRRPIVNEPSLHQLAWRHLGGGQNRFDLSKLGFDTRAQVSRCRRCGSTWPRRRNGGPDGARARTRGTCPPARFIRQPCRRPRRYRACSVAVTNGSVFRRVGKRVGEGGGQRACDVSCHVLADSLRGLLLVASRCSARGGRRRPQPRVPGGSALV